MATPLFPIIYGFHREHLEAYCCSYMAEHYNLASLYPPTHTSGKGLAPSICHPHMTLSFGCNRDSWTQPQNLCVPIGQTLPYILHGFPCSLAALLGGMQMPKFNLWSILNTCFPRKLEHPTCFFLSSELALSPDLAFFCCRFPASRDVILKKPPLFIPFHSCPMTIKKKRLGDWHLGNMLALHSQMISPAVHDQQNTTP